MQTIIITGANRGIGLELSRQFIMSGRRVIATCRNPGMATSLSELANSTNLEIFKLEVTDNQSIAEFCAAVSGRVIDVLINNAGEMGSDQQTLDAMDKTAWLETFKVNTIAPFELSAALHDNLKGSDNPRIISLSSQMASLSRQGSGFYAYRSSKTALNKIMQVMALELKADGIIVCPVNPGWVKTDMGGDAADITTQESAAGLMSLIDKLSIEQSGRFWNWNGEENPW